MDDIVGIFPTPIMICQKAIPAPLVSELIAHFEASQDASANVRTALLTHTPTTAPGEHAVYDQTLTHVLPRVRTFGEALLGEELRWGVKEIWVNRMDTGGAQKMHNHANSFVSGVIYLTTAHADASTVFHRHMGATSFLMENQNRRCKVSAFNSPVFRMPEVAPGDMVLFPSYVMHEVPPNPGPPRMTAAFNALPERLDSWGYTLQFR